MPSRQMQQQETEIQDALLLMMENLVHWHGGRWWSRNPTTLAWENDRFYGRRLALIEVLGNQMYADPEYQPTRWPDRLMDRQHQYQLLGRIRSRLMNLPWPPDFPVPDPRP